MTADGRAPSSALLQSAGHVLPLVRAPNVRQAPHKLTMPQPHTRVSFCSSIIHPDVQARNLGIFTDCPSPSPPAPDKVPNPTAPLPPPTTPWLFLPSCGFCQSLLTDIAAPSYAPSKPLPCGPIKCRAGLPSSYDRKYQLPSSGLLPLFLLYSLLLVLPCRPL